MKRRFISLLRKALVMALFGLSFQSQADGILRLDIARTNSSVVLAWTNTGVVLESSLVLSGAWSEVAGGAYGKAR